MSKKVLFGFIVFTLFFFSCGQRKEIVYKKYTCLDKSYSIEIPSFVVQRKLIGDFMSFENEQAKLIIIVERINESNISEYIDNKGVLNNDFTYDLFLSSDTASYYKVTRGNNMWSAYDLYMLKKMAGGNYLIKVSSDHLNCSEMIEIIKRIYSSMVQESSSK